MLWAEIDDLGRFAKKMIARLNGELIPIEMPFRVVYENQLADFVQFPSPLTVKIVKFYTTLKITEQDQKIAHERFSADRHKLGDLKLFDFYRGRMGNLIHDSDTIKGEINAFYLKTYGHEVNFDIDEMEDTQELLMA